MIAGYREEEQRRSHGHGYPEQITALVTAPHIPDRHQETVPFSHFHLSVSEFPIPILQQSAYNINIFYTTHPQNIQSLISSDSLCPAEEEENHIYQN